MTRDKKIHNGYDVFILRYGVRAILYEQKIQTIHAGLADDAQRTGCSRIQYVTFVCSLMYYWFYDNEHRVILSRNKDKIIDSLVAEGILR